MAEIRAEIARREQALADLDSPRKAAVLERMIGETGAAQRVERIDAEAAEHRSRLSDLRDAQAEIERRMAQAADERRRREAAERPSRAAQIVRERRRLADEATAAAQRCADTVRALQANGDALAELVGDTAAQRFLSFDAARHRAQSALARVFQLRMNEPLTVENSFIRVVSHETGERSWWTIADHEQNGLADHGAAAASGSGAC